MAATDLRDLIEWSNPEIPLHESLLTCQYTKDELINIAQKKMTVPGFPVHGQSIERCVQAVTRSSSTVYGEDRRDGFIKATLMHRKLMSSNDSKQDLMGLFD